MTQRLLFDRDVHSHQAGLLAAAAALGAARVTGWSAAEAALIDAIEPPPAAMVRDIRREIVAGGDPLGDWFCRLHSARRRRPQGATYTPAPIVRAMIRWAKRRVEPHRVVDPGAGSGRFIVSAGRAFPKATLIAVELDPVAAILCRAHLVAAGMQDRAQVLLDDYRSVHLPGLGDGERTLFVGNPPYVRHHLIDTRWKQWLITEGRKRGLHPSALAGLHIHFFLATAQKARPGDVACFITSAEWLDVNYGRVLRDLLLNGLGGERLIVLEPTAEPFPDAQTTAAITCMRLGTRPKSICIKRVARIDDLGDLEGGRRIPRERFECEMRWSQLTRPARKTPTGFIELGELCRVHRGQVTGANAVWIEGTHNAGLPESVLHPAVTRARELFAAGRELTDASLLRRVIDLPANLGELAKVEREAVERFLEWAIVRGAHDGYIARHRDPWWSVGLRDPAPILATYMARRPPAFVLNRCGARHLNIAHGLYPREDLDNDVLGNLVDYLCRRTTTTDGRTYAGGLTKFEPREMERLLVPGPDVLAAGGCA